MEDERRSLDDVMTDVLGAMPGAVEVKVRTAIGALVRASGLPPETAWCSVAAIVSAAHGDAPAQVVVVLPGKDGDGKDTDEREIHRFHPNGSKTVDEGVATEKFAPPTKH